MHTLILYSISSTASLCNTCITSHFNYATWFTYLSHMYILYSISSTISCLVSVLVSQSQTMVVRTGDTITLQCSNVTTVVGHTAWFKQVNGSEPVCISSMSHFEMFSNSTNKTTFFLKITEFEITDCGLCFCGLYPHSHVLFVNATVLKNSEDDGTMYLLPLVVILGVVTAVLLIVILILVLKIRRDSNRHNTGRIQFHDNIGPVNYTSNVDVFPMTNCTLMIRVSVYTRME
uniref:Immunoglobulin subtype domain-containing protein n=1 Tax=Oncorhynchus tshawytscha TaxID=74940 RepID=A0AAZ3RV34_ONCTS